MKSYFLDDDTVLLTGKHFLIEFQLDTKKMFNESTDYERVGLPHIEIKKDSLSYIFIRNVMLKLLKEV